MASVVSNRIVSAAIAFCDILSIVPIRLNVAEDKLAMLAMLEV